MNFEHLSSEELSVLYNNFVTYRDRLCDGWAKMDVYAFYKKYGLNPHPDVCEKEVGQIDLFCKAA